MNYGDTVVSPAVKKYYPASLGSLDCVYEVAWCACGLAGQSVWISSVRRKHSIDFNLSVSPSGPRRES